MAGNDGTESCAPYGRTSLTMSAFGGRRVPGPGTRSAGSSAVWLVYLIQPVADLFMAPHGAAWITGWGVVGGGLLRRLRRRNRPVGYPAAAGEPRAGPRRGARRPGLPGLRGRLRPGRRCGSTCRRPPASFSPGRRGAMLAVAAVGGDALDVVDRARVGGQFPDRPAAGGADRLGHDRLPDADRAHEGAQAGAGDRSQARGERGNGSGWRGTCTT